MQNIPFFKMSGSGNDFIIIDNRERVVDDQNLLQTITMVCRRRMSVGADGFILIEHSEQADFQWRFYNSDGSRAEMCGNGARCAARFAYVNHIAGEEMAFVTDAGVIKASISGDRVKIKMTDPSEMKIDHAIELEEGPLILSSINTGVPHAVIECELIDDVDVTNRGRLIRYHEAFAPDGTNVNFISRDREDRIKIRTYERGVENETLACGTGSIAGALITALKTGQPSPIQVITRSGGILNIHYENENDDFKNVFLEGDARIIYKGELCADALLE